ncbi:putative Na+-dependent transporter [Sphaerochaeta pleomorpha str. Grapes]|uniref:Putative Na+-dependent transporter n=2 Tax=Sphaerochaeta TaxID=399320 RepID=G8QQC2_SPHPG|nr:putative Na+-dependent transporter [Sphaerochaeta pleomorpha str. Grapes]
MEKKLRHFNGNLERAMPILTPTGVILGLLLGAKVSWMKPSVTYLFAFLTFCGALGINSSDFFKVLKKPKPIFAFLLGTNLIMPIIAWSVANVAFPTNTAIITGYILLMATPTAVSGYIWSSIYQGNGALSLTLILVSTALTPLLTPFTVRLLAQTSVEINTMGMILSLFKMVVLPSLFGILINNMTKGKVNEHITPSLKPFSKLSLILVIIINTSQVSQQLIASASWAYLPIALLCAIIAASGFPIAFVIGKWAKLPEEDNVSVTFAIALRNISAALVLAIDYFPPETSLPVIFGIVFQQSICAVMGHFFFGKKPHR